MQLFLIIKCCGDFGVKGIEFPWAWLLQHVSMLEGGQDAGWRLAKWRICVGASLQKLNAGRTVSVGQDKYGFINA